MMEVTILWKEEGRQEGLQQGLQQGMLSVILHQIERRFGDLDPETAEQIRGLSPDQLEKLSDAMLDFSSRGALMNWLQKL